MRKKEGRCNSTLHPPTLPSLWAPLISLGNGNLRAFIACVKAFIAVTNMACV